MSSIKTGRIYKIICSQSDVCYVGSTFNTLRDRFHQHKLAYNKWQKGKHSEIAIYPFFKQFGIDSFRMILIKEYSVCDRAHLEEYEQLWINKFRKTAVNRVNTIQIKKLSKKLSDKAYRSANKDKLSEYQKQYRETNKAAIKQRRSEKIQCDCGGKFTVTNKSQHQRIKMHQAWLQSSS